MWLGGQRHQRGAIVCAVRVGAGGGSFASNQFAAIVIGSHLTAAEHGQLHAALNSYMMALNVTELSIVSSTRALSSAVVLPDGGSGAVAGKGWTCTGLVRLPDGSWLVGNDGRGASATDPNLASVIHLSAWMDAILHQWTIASLGLPAASVQGVAWEPLDSGGYRGRIWFVLVGTSQPVKYLTIADDWSVANQGALAGVVPQTVWPMIHYGIRSSSCPATS